MTRPWRRAGPSGGDLARRPRADLTRRSRAVLVQRSRTDRAPRPPAGAAPARVFWSLALLAAATLAALSPAHATTYRQLALPDMLAAAEVAFFGTVSGVRVEERAGDPWTVVSFEVARAFVGATGGEPLELAFLGGALPGGESLDVALMPAFERGEEVLVLAYEGEFYSPIVGFRQGLWRRVGSDLVDEEGIRLGLDEEGALAPGAAGGEAEVVLDAVGLAFEGQQ